jgi:hypothetical protein
MVLYKIQVTAQHWKQPMLGGSLILLNNELLVLVLAESFFNWFITDHLP